MRIRGYKAELQLPGRQNPWALFLLIFSLVSLAQGFLDTHWLLSYREGSSIIPHESDLKRVGPFVMSKIRTRNAVLIGFTSSDGTLKYTEDAYVLKIQDRAVADFVSEYAGRPVAYLFIYKNNPMREIWGIDVNGTELLSYRDSVRNYKITDSLAYSSFWIFFAFLIWFFISIIDVQRIRRTV